MRADTNSARNRTLRRHRPFISLFAIAIISALLVSGVPTAQSQTPIPLASPTLKPELLRPTITVGPSETAVTTEAVRLDGRKLFTIAVPTVPDPAKPDPGALPIQKRVDSIETVLQEVADSNLAPADLSVAAQVDAKSGQPVISLNDRYLMTVTSLDAQLQGQTPDRWAEELTRLIREALLRAKQERESNYIIRQACLAGALALLIAALSLLLGRMQRRLRQQREQKLIEAAEIAIADPTDPTLPASAQIDAMQSHLQARQKRNLKDAQRRLLQLAQVILWAGGLYLILGLFYRTRWLQYIIFSTPLKVLSIVLLTYVAIRISDVVIDRFFSATIVEEFISPETSRRLTLRISTFSRVLRSVVGVICSLVALLAILSTIGVNLGPVLAGAGILGFAISLASQNVLKDMINGLLILSEDQYAVGDVVQIGQASGFVEHMDLRITQLRNAEGRLITIPNGSISVVENLSKDWSRVDTTITIAYDADVDRALELIHQVGTAMSKDSHWQSRIPEPPEVLGVEEFSNAGVKIRVWIKTAPLEQWRVAREFRRRLKLALDENGISIGVPQQSFWFRSTNPPFEKLLEGEMEIEPNEAPNQRSGL
jgi:small conductance mechanosensitive channel